MNKKYIVTLSFVFCIALSGCGRVSIGLAWSEREQGGSQTALEQSPLDQPNSMVDGWLRYESKTGGYSFSYPASYVVTEGEVGFTQLRLKDRIIQDVITFRYKSYELDNLSDDLAIWAERVDEHVPSGSYTKAYFPIDLGQTNGNQSKQVYAESAAESFVPMQAYLISNGRLVLELFAHFDNAQSKAILEEVAKSVEFSDGAPTDVEQLYAPDAAPAMTTLAEYFERMYEANEVSRALNIWAATGETTGELVEQMSERARADYERTVELQSRIQQELDERARLETPSAPADMQPEGGPFTYTVTSTTTFLPESPLLPQTTPTLPVREGVNGYKVYRERSTYGDEFLVQYSGDVWEYSPEETNQKLKHQAILDCELWLNEGAMGHVGQPSIAKIEAGENIWDRGIYQMERRAIYGAQVEDKYYLFGVTYAESATEAELEQCLSAAEEIIATFEPVE